MIFPLGPSFRPLAALSPRRKSLLSAGVVFVVSLAQYAHTVGYPLLWDAPVQVREDPAIRSLSDVPGHFVEASTAPGLFLAVLPARTEAVAWVYGDSTLLLGVLAAVATALHLRGRLVVPLVLSACAYLVREDAVLLPFALLVDRNRAGGATPPQP